MKADAVGVVRAGEEACREYVCHLIAGCSWYPCALPKGHEGGHRAEGECFEHGAYLGEPGCPPRCPSCPEPVILSGPSLYGFLAPVGQEKHINESSS